MYKSTYIFIYLYLNQFQIDTDLIRCQIGTLKNGLSQTKVIRSHNKSPISKSKLGNAKILDLRVFYEPDSSDFSCFQSFILQKGRRESHNLTFS